MKKYEEVREEIFGMTWWPGRSISTSFTKYILFLEVSGKN